MKKVFLHISAVAAALLLCLACSQDKPTVIPRAKLAKIYAEMLVMDQWVQGESYRRNKADTSLVYEPIFEKYGYDTEDYMASVEHYMKDPERYSRILRTTADILEERIVELKDIKKVLKRQAEIESFVTDFNIAEFYPYLSDEPYVHYYDSLAVEPDSFSVYRIVPIERADTLYDLLRMIICTDTTAVDTVAVETVKSEEVVKAKEEIKAQKLDMENVARKPMMLNDASKIIRHTKLDTLKLK